MNKADWSKELYYIDHVRPEFKVFKIKELPKSLNCHNNYKYDYFEINKGNNYYGKKRRHYSDYS